MMVHLCANVGVCSTFLSNVTVGSATPPLSKQKIPKKSPKIGSTIALTVLTKQTYLTFSRIASINAAE